MHKTLGVVTHYDIRGEKLGYTPKPILRGGQRLILAGCGYMPELQCTLETDAVTCDECRERLGLFVEQTLVPRKHVDAAASIRRAQYAREVRRIKAADAASRIEANTDRDYAIKLTGYDDD